MLEEGEPTDNRMRKIFKILIKDEGQIENNPINSLDREVNEHTRIILDAANLSLDDNNTQNPSITNINTAQNLSNINFR